jgi:hypothetical protein
MPDVPEAGTDGAPQVSHSNPNRLTAFEEAAAPTLARRPEPELRRDPWDIEGISADEWYRRRNPQPKVRIHPHQLHQYAHALWNPNWLPDPEELPESVPDERKDTWREMRYVHNNILRRWRKVDAQRRELQAQFDEEDERRTAYEEQQYWNGDKGGRPPTVTPQAERDAQLAEIDRHYEPGRKALAKLLQWVFDYAEQHHTEYEAITAQARATANDKRQEAQRLLDEADRLEHEPRKLERYVAHTAGQTGPGIQPRDRARAVVWTDFTPGMTREQQQQQALKTWEQHALNLAGGDSAADPMDIMADNHRIAAGAVSNPPGVEEPTGPESGFTDYVGPPQRTTA